MQHYTRFTVSSVDVIHDKLIFLIHVHCGPYIYMALYVSISQQGTSETYTLFVGADSFWLVSTSRLSMFYSVALNA